MESANQARLPIVESDAELEALVQEMSPLVLALAAVHMSGKLDILRSGIKPAPPAFNGDTGGSLSESDAAGLRAQVFAIMKEYRDAGQPEPYRPTESELHEMINFLTGMEMPSDYVSVIREDIALDAEDPRAFEWNRSVSDERKAHYPVVVIGAGMSGMLMGYRLKQAGLPFVILEKNESVGGTWFENRYPGLRVDVPSHAYSFSFTQDEDWSYLYSFQPDLLDYFRRCCERFGIADHIRFKTEVESAGWDDERAMWVISARTGSGARETLEAKAIISACGFFNRPFMPDFEGAEDYKGLRIHSARWPADLDVSGKRVIIIGNAATAYQMIPPVAKAASHLTVFQRSPSWTFLNPEYDREIRAAEKWGISHLPFYAGWMRAAVFNWTTDRLPDLMMVDPEWPQDGKTTSALNAKSREKTVADYERHLAGRPDLMEKLLPDYPPYLKRPTIGTGEFFDALKRDNVNLCTDPIVRFTEAGIIDGAGVLHEADIVVYTTGFKVQDYLGPIKVRGRDGKDIKEYWQNRPGGYLGVVVPNYPNFFMMYGPGTNLGYNGNLIFNSELQAGYIGGCLRLMVENDLPAIEVKEAVYDAFLEKTGALLDRFVWALPASTTYTRNAAGRVTSNWPWSLKDMWTWMKDPDPQDFVLRNMACA